MKTILVTGCSGYVGSLLVESLIARTDVELVIGLDKAVLPEKLQDITKFHFVQALTSGAWEDEVARFSPTHVVHAAWQIRELYANTPRQELWNINGSHQVFDFVFNQAGVERLVYISSVASYGAYRNNTRERIFTGQDDLRQTDYRYAEEKRITEMLLLDLHKKYANHKKNLPAVFVLRPVSITGPIGRSRGIFNLQSILSGKANDSIFARVIAQGLSFTPVSKLWARQFVHEKDVVGVIEHMLFSASPEPGIDTCNICPPGKYLTGADMAKILHKRVITLPAYLYKLLFFLAWHISLGKIPTSRGSYKAYCYPIVVDGSKLTTKYHYTYQYTVQQAVTG